MSTVVFVGPTISAREVSDILPEAEIRPPAGCRDVLRAVRGRATVVVLIDGYFDHQLSVWHKEILFALSRGVRVYGAASMGALRAAELHSFGMRGVGKVFEAYRDGSLDADDEVAVAHEAPERGYLAVSEALVNVRATLERAASSQVVSLETAESLVAAGKSLFYPQRTYASIVERAVERGLPRVEGTHLLRWLEADPSHWVDQKRTDAVELLRELSRPSSVTDLPSFHFEYTESWHEFARQDAEVQPLELDEDAVQRAADQFRRDHGLLTPEATLEWMRLRGLDLEAFSALMREAAVASVSSEHARRSAREEDAPSAEGDGEIPSKSVAID